MKKYFAYTRVSTLKQGEKGVSLQEQRDCIAGHAQRHGLEIAQWFEERVTAAKRGRIVFNQMLQLLKRGKADGVIIHKIDRSARNLKDWADLGELIDQGVDVHFANESLDLNSRGGRLSADIQAVVAADYIRNLREETRKGFYGRLKQGLYPLPAPIGYLDQGKGKPKVIDPVKGPLVRKVFELYANGQHSQVKLVEEAYRLGLRNRRSDKITYNGISVMLNNPFYMGLIRLRRTGETFPGIHEPLISKPLFDQVQRVLRGKTKVRTTLHHHLFQRLLTCKQCGYSLISEIQKGHVYYRCHTRGCPTMCIREEAVEEAILQTFAPLRLIDMRKTCLERVLAEFRVTWQQEREMRFANLQLRLEQITQRLNQLTDAYLDRVLDKKMFDQRKTALLMEQKDVEGQLTGMEAKTRTLPDLLARYLELAGTAYKAYSSGFPDEKRDLVSSLTSNREVYEKNVVVTLSSPFRELVEWLSTTSCDPCTGLPRTLDTLWQKLVDWFNGNEAGAGAPSVASDDSGREKNHKEGKLAG